MKHPHLTIIALSLLVSVAVAQTPDQLFQEGNLLYQQGKLDDAREAYKKILSKGYVSGVVLYNLGNAYYRSGQIPEAILFYERARRYIPQDEDLRHNLQMANLLITDRIDPAPRLFFWGYWDNLKDSFSLHGVTWLAYLVYLVVLSFLSLLFLARTYRTRKAFLFGSGVSGAVLILFVVLFVAKLSEFTRDDEAIIMAPVATVKNSPSEKSSDAFVLHGGTKVRVFDQVSEYMAIRLPDGKVGWVERATIELI